MGEINLLDRYPQSKRPIDERGCSHHHHAPTDRQAIWAVSILMENDYMGMAGIPITPDSGRKRSSGLQITTVSLTNLAY